MRPDCGVISLQIQARLGITQDAPTPSAPTSSAQTFFKRLPFELGADLISLSMQDHYVEVTTAKGTDLILMRRADAIGELDALDGVQIHRSHWVVKSAMRGTTRQDGRLMLELIDGRILPVSRTYVATVRAVLNA